MRRLSNCVWRWARENAVVFRRAGRILIEKERADVFDSQGTMIPMDEIVNSWAFIGGMACIQVLMILSPLVILAIVLVMLRRKSKETDEAE
jgi:hypothetical protein